MNKEKIFWVAICFTVGVVAGLTFAKIDNLQQKSKKNLKCIQGELYEEIKPKFYVKSHLECFEERTF